MTPVSRRLSRGLLIAAVSGAALVGGAGMAHATSPDAGGTKLDYNIVQHFNPSGSVTDVTGILYNKGVLIGKGKDIQDVCTFVLKGTVRKGGAAHFTMTFDQGTPCAGVVVTYKGTLAQTSGQGTFTSTNGGNGTWTASDPTSSTASGGAGRGNKA